NQLIYGSITDLQRKEKALLEENNNLRKKIKEKELALSLPEHVETSPSLTPSETLPILNISGAHQSSGTEGEEEGVMVQPQPKTLLPPWMVRPMNG
ncbi:hypothetical protein FRX31_022727, partial [Thalictrum thalictroides]